MSGENEELEKMYDVPLPSSQVDRDKLDNGIKSIKDAMLRIDSEKDHITQTLDDLHALFPDIPKTYMRRVASDLHKSTFSTRIAKEDSYREFFNAFNEIVAKVAAK